MGKIFLHGRSNKGVDTSPYAKLTVTCQPGLTVVVNSTTSSLVYKTTADGTGVAVFEKLNKGNWDVTFEGIDHPPTKRVNIDKTDCEVTIFIATINVTYPRGSTCTCTQGDIILTSPDTSGLCIFTISNEGEWTIHATNGINSGNEVIITESESKCYSVNIVYDLYIFSIDRQVQDVETGWPDNDAAGLYVTKSDNGLVIIENRSDTAGVIKSIYEYDLTPYMYIHFTNNNYMSGDQWYGLRIYEPGSNILVASMDFNSGSGLPLMEISMLKGIYNIGIYISANNRVVCQQFSMRCSL